MDHYADVDIRPDPEFSSNQLMSALYAKLHRALVAQNSSRIGVSFPGFDAKAPHLGTRLRLHGDMVSLTALLKSDWLAGIRDHVRQTLPTRVPEVIRHCAVRRVQVKSNPERLRRRLIRRHDIDMHEAQQRIPDNVARLVDLPFVQLQSASTGHTFKLFIENGLHKSNPISGEFKTYGLSQVATIPWFPFFACSDSVFKNQWVTCLPDFLGGMFFFAQALLRTGTYAVYDLVHCRAGSSENAATGRREMSDVHCRAGSSEIYKGKESILPCVHCRAGSSESDEGCLCAQNDVHCRAGSSESGNSAEIKAEIVHCRAGSSEIDLLCVPDGESVHCRAGCSETLPRTARCTGSVHCRAGSSENQGNGSIGDQRVHCRAGSSES